MELSAAVCRWPSEDVRLEVATRRDVAAMPHPVTIADKTLDTNGQRLSFVVPDSWRQLLKNVCIALPVSKVSSPKVLPALVARFCWQCLHKIELDFLAQFCGLSLSAAHKQEYPTHES